MRRLVDDLLWLARFDSTGPTPTSEATDLGVLAEQAAQRFTAVAEARGLTLRVERRAGVDDDQRPAGVARPPPRRAPRQRLPLHARRTARSTCAWAAGTAACASPSRTPGRASRPASAAHIFDRFRRASDAPGRLRARAGHRRRGGGRQRRSLGGRHLAGRRRQHGGELDARSSAAARRPRTPATAPSQVGADRRPGAAAAAAAPRLDAQSSSLMLSATARGTSSLSASTVAARMPSTLPKRRSRRALAHRARARGRCRAASAARCASGGRGGG